MPLWKIDFDDIDSETAIPGHVDDDQDVPEGYGEEFEKVDNFVTENLLRAKETKDHEMVGFIVQQGIMRYTRLGLKKKVLEEQIWITEQLGKGVIKNFQAEAKGAELKTQIAYVQEMIGEQKKKDVELRNRIASLRAERDFKKSRLEAVLRTNRGSMNEISHVNKRRALIKERLRLDTIEYEKEKAQQDDLRKTFTGYSNDLDRQLENAPWLVEKQEKAARRKELEDEVKSLEEDLAKIDLIEKRNRIAEESERDLPFKQFCVQLAELYVKREKLFKQLEEEKAKVKKFEEERRRRRSQTEETSQTSQMDCTQAILDGDLDDEEIDTHNLNVPMTQESQQTQPICRKRAQSPTESSASSEANDELSDGGEQPTAVVPPPAKKVSIVEPIGNPDESVDEGGIQTTAHKENMDESRMEEEEEEESQSGNRSQQEQMETDEREEEEERNEGKEEQLEQQEQDEFPVSRMEEEEEEESQSVDRSQLEQMEMDEREEEEERNEGKEEQLEQQEQEEFPVSQESQVTVASQESFIGEMVEQEEVEQDDGFLHPSLIPAKVAPMAVEENGGIMENGEEDVNSFNPEMLLDISAHSNDPGGDFFDMMNNQSSQKRAVVDAAGSSPAVAAGGDSDFMSMFGGGGGGDLSGAADGEGPSFSFNFGGAEANETSGAGEGGGGEFNFFGF